SSPILITGASGFVALHTIIQALQQGYKVRATLRNLARETELRAIVAKFADAKDNLEFVVADLMQDSNWDEAMRGCEYVLHVASPFPLFEPKHEDELILPAVQGTQRVLRAAHNGNIKRVVVVSSLAAVYSGRNGENRIFDENDWSMVENNIGAYAKSKTLAEREAWNFINGAENINKMEMVAINPPLILGPILDAQNHTSIELIRVFMRGEVPGVAKIKMGIVDARDVASALLLAMETPEAAGRRFLCSAATLWYKEIAEILRREYSARGYKKIPRIEFPSFAVRLMALFDKKIAVVIRDLDWEYDISSEEAKRVLKWNPRSKEEAILSMAESLIELGLV
ncbi:MAG: aldehyde reductase, partial [Anaerolineales bacterium]|nr:aldehyde reductase [Anaerolineales bacterium]